MNDETHWKVSEQLIKAALLVLSGEFLIKICMRNQAGKFNCSFVQVYIFIAIKLFAKSYLCCNESSVRMFDEALKMWRYDSDVAEVDTETVPGFPKKFYRHR
jgi:hypothetical protein